ncbi:NUDIX hydrolase [Rhodobacteraceae bacterium RKSG542]|uniref:NUDIX domain-containing protein n=1 Tax=Pseudovibrio flavus TaxID=2529854 RepID=UPI0012BC8299|nr:NUDIX hydrolase [Pseudovibrio flavus]MTI16194.1 NUDIX hydrolase [Pseudovibrio flavus]
MPRIAERKTVYEGKGLLEQLTVERVHEDGRKHTSTEMLWTYGDSIAVLPYDPLAKTVLLVRQVRSAPLVRENTLILEACAGKIEVEDKDIFTAAKREAEEELGITPTELQHVGTVYMNPVRLAEHANLFLAQYTAGEQQLDSRDQDEDEDIEVVEMPVSELINQYRSMKIRCPRLMMLTQALLIKLSAV